MFKLKKSPDFWWPISLELPGENGKYEKATFDAQFKRLGQTEIDKLIEDIQTSKVVKDITAVNDLLIGWRGVQDADGNEIPFSEVTKDQLLEIPGVAAALMKTFIEAIYGARRKN